MFHADLHVHSRFSRACSKYSDVDHLAWWALRKGITVAGTGDFTHPAWAEELREQLRPAAEPGLFQLGEDAERRLRRTSPGSCGGQVRFMLSAEISTIYRAGDRTRKVHHLVYAPTFDAADRITAALSKVGNLASDGRPILGLDSRHLLETTLDGGPGCYLVPAQSGAARAARAARAGATQPAASRERAAGPCGCGAGHRSMADRTGACDRPSTARPGTARELVPPSPLDPDQRAAAQAPGPLMIIAGPGTGKTRTLTHRIGYQIAERGLDPHSCLAITFTRRAAEELRARLADLLRERAAGSP